MRWRGLPGNGRASTGARSKRLWPEKQPVLTRRTGEKKGSKRHILVDARGVPLSLIVTGAHRHDLSQFSAVLDALIVDLPKGRERFLYADKGYDGDAVREQIGIKGYIPRIPRRNRRRGRGRPWKNRRWVVEAAHSWFNRFRKLLVRYEKLTESYEALLHLAAAIICWRKVTPIYG